MTTQIPSLSIENYVKAEFKKFCFEKSPLCTEYIRALLELWSDLAFPNIYSGFLD